MNAIEIVNAAAKRLPMFTDATMSLVETLVYKSKGNTSKVHIKAFDTANGLRPDEIASLCGCYLPEGAEVIESAPVAVEDIPTTVECSQCISSWNAYVAKIAKAERALEAEAKKAAQPTETPTEEPKSQLDAAIEEIENPTISVKLSDAQAKVVADNMTDDIADAGVELVENVLTVPATAKDAVVEALNEVTGKAARSAKSVAKKIAS